MWHLIASAGHGPQGTRVSRHVPFRSPEEVSLRDRYGSGGRRGPDPLPVRRLATSVGRALRDEPALGGHKQPPGWHQEQLGPLSRTENGLVNRVERRGLEPLSLTLPGRLEGVRGRSWKCKFASQDDVRSRENCHVRPEIGASAHHGGTIRRPLNYSPPAAHQAVTHHLGRRHWALRSWAGASVLRHPEDLTLEDGWPTTSRPRSPKGTTGSST